MPGTRPRIAHGLFTWQDGRPALEACLRSTAGHVDEVIVADGLIDGVPAGGLPWHSDLAWLAEPLPWLPERITVSCKQWRSLSAACTWILTEARRLGCDWLLYIDADQELHNGGDLRGYVEQRNGQTAAPIPRVDPGLVHVCPWQLVNVNQISHYLAGCFVVELTDGYPISLSPNGDVTRDHVPQHAPWISHHPERRPPWRVHNRLGQLETVLEPPPFVDALQLPVDVVQSPAVSTVEPAYMCPQCGTRYQGPGVCQNEHPSVEIVPVAQVQAEADAAAGAADAGDSSPAPAAPAADPAAAEVVSSPQEVPQPDAVDPANGTEVVAAPTPADVTPETVAEPTGAATIVSEARDLIQQAFDKLSTL